MTIKVVMANDYPIGACADPTVSEEELHAWGEHLVKTKWGVQTSDSGHRVYVRVYGVENYVKS